MMQNRSWPLGPATRPGPAALSKSTVPEPIFDAPTTSGTPGCLYDATREATKLTESHPQVVFGAQEPLPP